MENQYIDDVPQSVSVSGPSTDLAKLIIDVMPIIEDIKMYILGWKKVGDKYYEDQGRTAIMNEQGADAYIEWLKSMCCRNITLSNHEHNEIAMRLRFNEMSIAKLIVLKEKEWQLDFRYSDFLVDIADSLGTATLNASKDGITLERLTANYNITQRNDIQRPEKQGFFGSIFKRKQNEQ